MTSLRSSRMLRRFAVDSVVDAAFAGRVQVLDSQFAAGAHRRHSRRHDAQRGCAASGASASGAVGDRGRRQRRRRHPGSFRPPLFFRREPLVEAALAAWTAPRLEKTMAELAEATLAARRWPIAAEATTHRALLVTATNARARSV